MVMALFGIAGFAMLLGSGDPHIQYAGTFLGAMGIYPCVPNTISWAANNIEGVYKRGISLGFIIGYGNLNGEQSILDGVYGWRLGTKFLRQGSYRRTSTVQRTSLGISLAMLSC